MGWKAFVRGEEFDVKVLMTLYPIDRNSASGDVAFGRSDDHGAFFESPSIDNDDLDMIARREIALGLLDAINGVARTHVSSFQPVALTGQFQDRAGNLKGGGVGSAAGNVEWRVFAAGRTGLGDGEHLPPQRPTAAQLTALATQNSDVEDALALLSRPGPLNYFDLHKVYEIIAVAVGGKHVLDRSGWADDENDFRRFRGSANHPAVSGSEARHARMSGEPPQDEPMRLPEARTFISTITHRWLDSLVER